MKTSCRNGEQGEKLWYRSDRFFVVNNQWYFSTREKIDVGPFGSESSAQNGLGLFIKKMSDDKSDKQVAAQIAIQGQWAQTLYH